MGLIAWIKGSKIARWIGAAVAAVGLLKFIELMGANRGRAELSAEQNEQRVKDAQTAKQDYNDANSQTDADLDDRLTRG